VTSGSTYLLRLTNAALLNDHFFKVANHTLTVVRADGNDLQPFETDVVVITPGQTTDVLLTANQPKGLYYGGVSVAEVLNVGAPPPATPAVVIFQYEGSNSSASPAVIEFPSMFNIVPVDNYTALLKGLLPYSLPKSVDVDLVYVAGIATVDCNANEPCTTKIAGTIQNATFDEPQNTSVLQAYYNDVPGVFTTDVPDLPPVFEDFTSARPDGNYILGNRGTRARVLQFNNVVQLVLQNVNSLGILDHPFHLHGHDFYVVGRNYSNFNPAVDPAGFNLVNPPKFNTISIPNGGWVAIRFQANNPGVWLLHCHFDRHKTWGMETVFITENGFGASETLPGPLHPPPSCT
jgi:laccase